MIQKRLCMDVKWRRCQDEGMLKERDKRYRYAEENRLNGLEYPPPVHEGVELYAWSGWVRWGL